MRIYKYTFLQKIKNQLMQYDFTVKYKNNFESLEIIFFDCVFIQLQPYTSKSFLVWMHPFFWGLTNKFHGEF